MEDEIKPGYGRAWRSDWHQRLASRVHELGYATPFAFTAAHPLATLQELVDVLGTTDFAPIQMQWIILDNDGAVPSLPARAKSLLLRYLRELPTGWPVRRDDMEEVHRVLSYWHAAIPDEHSEPARLVTFSLLRNETIAPHWLPISVDDAHLDAAFSHWIAKDSRP